MHLEQKWVFFSSAVSDHLVVIFKARTTFDARYLSVARVLATSEWVALPGLCDAQRLLSVSELSPLVTAVPFCLPYLHSTVLPSPAWEAQNRLRSLSANACPSASPSSFYWGGCFQSEDPPFNSGALHGFLKSCSELQ